MGSNRPSEELPCPCPCPVAGAQLGLTQSWLWTYRELGGCGQSGNQTCLPVIGLFLSLLSWCLRSRALVCAGDARLG